MTPLFKKLNLKEQKAVLILNHPTEFQSEIEVMQKEVSIITKTDDICEIEFVLTFVKTKAEIDNITPIINKKLKGDGVVWFAYPKRTSKKYKAEINRDNGWDILGIMGFEGVRAVAIDDDWSAIRFRKVEFVKVMNRRPEFAKTKEGQLKIKNTSR